MSQIRMKSAAWDRKNVPEVGLQYKEKCTKLLGNGWVFHARAPINLQMLCVVCSELTKIRERV
eukprot:4816356-Amphidinium_carterae.1